MTPRIIEVECDHCGQRYDSIALAEECARQPGITPTFKVGDIVKAGGARFCWFDGDARWIEDQKADPMTFYYVVAAVDNHDKLRGRTNYVRPVRSRYHLFTGAMKKSSGYQSGYTFDAQHCTPELVVNPPKFIVADSKRFLGQKTESLL